MKYQDLARIALKMFGIYWLVKAVTNLVQIVLVLPKLADMPPGTFGKADIIGWAFLVVLYAALGYVLTFRTGTIIQTIKVDENKISTQERKDSISEYQRLGLFLLGVFFAVPAASTIIPQIIKLWSVVKISPDFSTMYKDVYLEKEWPQFVENAIQLVFGVVLIMGRTRLSALWRRLRPLSTTGDVNKGERDKE